MNYRNHPLVFPRLLPCGHGINLHSVPLKMQCSRHKAKRVEHTELLWIILKGKKTPTSLGIKMYGVRAVVKARISVT